MNNYGIDIWGDDNFIIEDGLIKINYSVKPSLLQIVQQIRANGNTGPLIFRFPHIVQKQIEKLYKTFNQTIDEYNYISDFYAVFPLKVNQFPNHILPMLKRSKLLNYGLEAGSKAELLLAMSFNNKNAPITVNGFKDKDMIMLGFVAFAKGYNITLTIEGLNELETIIEVYKELKLSLPNIGIRVKLHSSGSGTWAKSGGIDSKFGLSSTEILDAFDMMKRYDILDSFKMIHFHIGSHMSSISPLKKALKESGHIYCELKKMGATSLESINIGGGLAIEYSQYGNQIEYSLKEFASDVIYTLNDIAVKNGIKPPNIYTESGRFVSAQGSILIVPTLELYSSDLSSKNLREKEINPPIIDELKFLLSDISKDNAKEYMHDSLEHLESILTLFDLGYVDLTDRSNAEVLTNLIIKKAISLKDTKNDKELKKLDDKIQEKYLLNFSIFQSLPDFWGIDQHFPIAPISHLNTKPNRSANIWDVTCDSDGEIPFDSSKPLYLHDIDLKKEDYFLSFFNIGAYQDILGMKHNLFSSPTQLNIEFTKDSWKIKHLIPSQSILDIFEDLDYDIDQIQSNLFDDLDDIRLQNILKNSLKDNSYLKTTIKGNI